VFKTPRPILALLVAAAVAGPPVAAAAGVDLVSQRIEVDYWAGVDGEEGRIALSRLSLRPELALRFGEGWRLEMAGRLEGSRDRTGLGTVRSFSPAARPLIDRDDLRLDIDQLVLSRRFGRHRLSIGKQIVAWGVLDGLQVTDRFDPVRRRDFVLTEVRPERLARWGLRWRIGGEGLNADLVVAFDPTVNQLAQAGDRFQPVAPRLLGGMEWGASVGNFLLTQSDRDHYWRDATAGFRLSRRFGRADASVLFLSGPDPEPLLQLAGTMNGRPVVELTHPRRKLIGTTLEFAAGSQVWRFELAHSPDQPINTATDIPLSSDRRSRTLAGVGVDWNAPHGWFVNAQLAVDHLGAGSADAVRPRSDLIATLRAQRSIVQDTVTLRSELLGSLSDGDGVARASVDWQYSDPLRLSLGADWLFGTRDGLFGQFRDASQAWARIRLTY
jgi:hypothetical protein